jgi:hypothetical protein
MAYDLVVSRLGALAGLSEEAQLRNGARSLDDLKKAFLGHLTNVTNTDEFKAANRAVVDAAPHGSLLHDQMLEANGIEVTDMPSADEFEVTPGSQALVGALPWQRVACEIGDMQWVLRSRASMTSCALQPETRQTKLWWTFEAIPREPDPSNRPSEEHVREIMHLSDRIVKTTMPLLRKAYAVALQPLTPAADEFAFSGEKIRINLTDNDTKGVAALFDAICIESRRVAEIERLPICDKARSGLDELRGFVGDAIGDRNAFNDDSMEVIRPRPDLPLISGIVCRQENTADRTRAFAGFARRLGNRNGFLLLPPEQQAVYLDEDNIRQTSAARRLSAMLAGREARRFDRASTAN